MQKYVKPQIIVKSFQSNKARVKPNRLIYHLRVLNLSWIGILVRQQNVVKRKILYN